MGEEDSQCSLEDIRLASGQRFPIPITLPVEPEGRTRVGMDIALRDTHNRDRDSMALKVLGTRDLRG